MLAIFASDVFKWGKVWHLFKEVEGLTSSLVP